MKPPSCVVGRWQFELNSKYRKSSFAVSQPRTFGKYQQPHPPLLEKYMLCLLRYWWNAFSIYLAGQEDWSWREDDWEPPAGIGADAKVRRTRACPTTAWWRHKDDDRAARSWTSRSFDDAGRSPKSGRRKSKFVRSKLSCLSANLNHEFLIVVCSRFLLFLSEGDYDLANALMKCCTIPEEQAISNIWDGSISLNRLEAPASFRVLWRLLFLDRRSGAAS